MAKCLTESTCKETYQVKQADLAFEESAIEEHLIEEMNEEKKEESDQEESLNYQMNQVTPLISEAPTEASNDRSMIIKSPKAYPTIEISSTVYLAIDGGCLHKRD